MSERLSDTAAWCWTRRFGLAAAVVFGLVGMGQADTLFWEDFDGYTSFNNAQDPTNPGIPKISEGADEYWYGGRFEAFDDGTINQDLAVQKYGGYGNPTPVGRFEDDAGLLFHVDAGYENVTLSFDWRTYSATSGDRFVAGYYVGDLGFDQGPNRFRDFFSDDFGGDQNAVVQWWDTEWVEIVRGISNSFQHVHVNLPDDTSLWVAFWLDNGEHDYGKLDNVDVQGHLIISGNDQPVPEPATLLLVVGLGLVAFVRRRASR